MGLSFARGLGTMSFVGRAGYQLLHSGCWVWVLGTGTWESKGTGMCKAREAREQGTRWKRRCEHKIKAQLCIKIWGPQGLTLCCFLGKACFFPSVVYPDGLWKLQKIHLLLLFKKVKDAWRSDFLTRSRNFLLQPLESARWYFSSRKTRLEVDLLLLRNIFFLYYVFMSIFKGNLCFPGLYLYFYVTF